MDCYRLQMRVKFAVSGLAALAIWLVSTGFADAQHRGSSKTPDADHVERGLDSFRTMMAADPWSNPGFLDIDRGADLWETRRGPNNVSLETCDLGKGPGVTKGAYAALPRYFEDAGQVMDLETRLLWCMRNIQGMDTSAMLKNPYPANGHPVGDLGALATYVAARSDGMAIAPTLSHPRERAAVATGKAIFNHRSGPFDFSCASCHGVEGKRIRLQPLADLATPEGARKVVGEWPAYRVSTTNVMTFQHRLFDCFRQMRLPRLRLGSPASIALTAYLMSEARGGVIKVPGLKR
ncbi:MAG: sulfur oxidation c-type cytochrome SoxA [Hyphomicrobiaceae bacterium]